MELVHVQNVKTLVRGGTVVTCDRADRVVEGDVLLDGGEIVFIGQASFHTKNHLVQDVHHLRVIEGRLVIQERAGNSMHALGVRVDVALGIYIAVEMPSRRDVILEFDARAIITAGMKVPFAKWNQNK